MVHVLHTVYMYYWQVLLDWSSHYWQLLLDQDRPRSDGPSTPDPRQHIGYRRHTSQRTMTGGLFSPSSSSSYSRSSRYSSSPAALPRVISQDLREEAWMSLASVALFQQDPNRALELYTKVGTPQACWNSCQVSRGRERERKEFLLFF